MARVTWGFWLWRGLASKSAPHNENCSGGGAIGKLCALIFDFDGVIIDTETPDYTTWQEVFHSYGVELDRSWWTQLIGGGDGFDVHGHLEELAGTRIDRESLRQRRRRRYLSLVDANPLLPGVLDYIVGAKQLGLRVGVASSSSRAWVERHLGKRDMLGHFDCIKVSDDVANVKPDPELYTKSVECLGTSPENALVIEDSANGITAAKSAGLYCVAVPNQMTRDLPIDHADLRLDALSDIPLGSLLQRFA